MKRISSIFFISLIYSFLSTPSHSQPMPFFHSGLKRNNFTLFTLNVVTRTGKPVAAKMSEADYVGISPYAPCSDLRLFTSGYGEAELVPGYYPFGADNFRAYPGPGYTCFKMDFTIKGRVYSTGNIQLNWSPANQRYIDANPKIVPLEIDC